MRISLAHVTMPTYEDGTDNDKNNDSRGLDSQR